MDYTPSETGFGFIICPSPLPRPARLSTPEYDILRQIMLTFIVRSSWDIIFQDCILPDISLGGSGIAD